MERLEQAAVEAARASACADLYPKAHAVLKVVSSRITSQGLSRRGLSDVSYFTGIPQGEVRNILDDLFDLRHLLSRDDGRWVVATRCECRLTPLPGSKLERVPVLTALQLDVLLDSNDAAVSPGGGASTAPASQHCVSVPARRAGSNLGKTVRKENSRSLAQYFLERLVESGGIAGGNTNIQALAGTMARLRRDGVGLEKIRTTVDVFFDVHPEWSRDPRPAWKLYISNIKRLLQEAERKTQAPDHLHRKVGSARTDYLVGLTPQERTQAQLQKFLGQRSSYREEQVGAAAP